MGLDVAQVIGAEPDYACFSPNPNKQGTCKLAWSTLKYEPNCFYDHKGASMCMHRLISDEAQSQIPSRQKPFKQIY